MATKVMKYQLIYKEGCTDYDTAKKELWNLQRATREIKNKSIQLLALWDRENYDHYKQTGEWLDVKKEKGCNVETWLYNELKDFGSFMYAGNYGATIRGAKQKYDSSRKEIAIGNMSLPSYKSDQPIQIRGAGLMGAVKHENSEYTVSCPLFASSYAKSNGFGNRFTFLVRVKDGTQRAIINRVIDGQYKIGESQIVYEKGKWFFMMTYSFTSTSNVEVDPDKVLGVDLGVVNAIYASSLGEHDRFIIPGNEVAEKAKRLEERKKALQKQAVFCGESRVGHGTKKRVRPIYKQGDLLDNFKKTVNHRYSKALVDFALKHGYGTIQMEDLSGVKESPDWLDKDESHERHKLLNHWTYYDIQTKIKSKASAVGIEVKLISPKFTSQRCSKCGCISKENRKTQAVFKCVSCGYETNADFNASQNISIPNIDKVIEKQLKYAGANPK